MSTFFGGFDANTPESQGYSGITPEKPYVKDVRLTGFDWACSSTKDPSKPYALVVTFEQVGTGKTHREVVFDINTEQLKKAAAENRYMHKSGPKQGTAMTYEEIVNTEVQKLNRFVMHILRANMPADKAVIPAVTTFKELIQAAGNLLKPYLNKLDFKVKFVYDRRGNVTFPTYPPFIKKMEDPTGFDWNDQYDLVTRPKPDKETTSGPVAPEEPVSDNWFTQEN